VQGAELGSVAGDEVAVLMQAADTQRLLGSGDQVVSGDSVVSGNAVLTADL
jgi:hypothetical protein